MSHPGRRADDSDAEEAARTFGPEIVGIFHRFADPDMEQRYRAALAPQAQLRLVSLVWVALCVTLVRIALPTLGLVQDTGASAALLIRVVQILLCLGLILAMRKQRSYTAVEAGSAFFAVTYIASRCCLLPQINTDGSLAMVVGTVPLLYFGSPLRVGLLAPIMLAGSAAMLAAWAMGHPAPSRLAVVQVIEWLVVLNLLGIVAMRMMRFSLRRLFSLSHALRHLATHDGLTGIANRRHYDQVLDREWSRCRLEGCDISLVLIDVDFFKLLNDGVGHEAGDDCLRDIARLLEHCVREPGSLVARTGGEEFACLLPGLGEVPARAVANRITAALRDQCMPHPDSPIGPHITISLGVATARPAEGFTMRDLTGLADRLMYSAKSDGRDCIRQQRLSRGGSMPALAAAQ
jgi:diguanylate cyclase (GGDEF)-like protein